MSLFILTQTVLLLIIIFLCYLLSWFWPPDSPWAPWWKTDKKTAKRMFNLIKLKKSDKIYDLGAGDATALIIAAKEFDASCVGVEIDILRAWYASKSTESLRNKIKIINENFFNIDISPATVVLAYLIPKTLVRLKKKLLTELRPGTKVICYRYPIPYLPLELEDKEKRIYIYEIPKRAKGKNRIK